MVEILDCTLRDGSYAIDFGFTSRQTCDLTRELAYLRFPYIEVGHGVGIGASDAGYGVAACDDHTYALSACGSTWGMFCIPGIATLEKLRQAIAQSMWFVRVGVNVDRVDEGLPFIETARDLGIHVFSNLMKSYAMPHDRFAHEAKKCVEAGAQCIYIVDSAGSMLPEDITKYYKSLKDLCPDVKVGFHGHNNIGLAVANALHCVNLGVDIVDCTLQGIGRSGGNVPTEQFLAALMLSGNDVPHDLVSVSRVGDMFIRPLLRNKGLSPLDVVAGVAGFHSSYMRRLLEVSRRSHVDPLRLMLAVSARDKIDASEELMESCARNLAVESWPTESNQYYGEEQYESNRRFT